VSSTSQSLVTRPAPAHGNDMGPDDDGNADDVEEFDEYGPDEHPAHYPRPGQGLMKTLPPEQDDSHYLVDDDNRYGDFSHIYQADPHAANAGLSVGTG